MVKILRQYSLNYAPKVVAEIPLTENAKRVLKINLEADYVVLPVSVAEPLQLEVGDYCDLNGTGRFEVIDVPTPTPNVTTGGYDYEIKLEATYMLYRNRVFKYMPETGGQEAAWSLTAPLRAHLDIMERNFKAVGILHPGNQPYRCEIVGGCDNADKSFLMQYSNTSCISALINLATKWECDVWVEEYVIKFGRCEYDSDRIMRLEEGVDVLGMSREESSTERYNRIIAFGSERNIPRNYRAIEDTTQIMAGVVQRRLMLPKGTPYVDVAPDMTSRQVVERVVVFEDVYPRTNLIVERKEIYTDSYTDEETGEEVTKTYYRVVVKALSGADNDSSHIDFNFSQDYILQDETLHMIFQSGKLNGMDFEVKFNPKGEPEKIKEAWNSQAQMFELVVNDRYGRELPDSILCPEVGDLCHLYGWDTEKITVLSITAAENELLDEARKLAQKLNKDTNNYICPIRPVNASGNDFNAPYDPTFELKFMLGDRVMLINPGFFEDGFESRVIGVEYPLDYPWRNTVLTVGETGAYSKLKDLTEKVEGITVGMMTGNAGGTQPSGNGSSVYVIGQNDPTAPTNRNVFSALYSKALFLLKGVGYDIVNLWRFIKGLHIGDFVSGSRGAAIDEDGNTEVESIFVRSYMKVMELIYNRLNAVEGDFSFSDSGTIERIVGDVAYIRKRWDGDFTAFQPGDIVYGYVNNLASSGEYYRAWAWVRSVDREANTLTLASYPDADVPGGKNYPLAAHMVIAKHGNNIEATAANAAQYPTVIRRKGTKFTNVRQSCFYISSEQGCIMQLVGVNKPILERENYGTILGKIPAGTFSTEIMEMLNSEHPYLYARGILVQDLIRLGYEGVSVRTANYRGEWSADTALSPTEYYRSTSDTYDTVTWRGVMWQCVSTHATTAEPSDTNSTWARMTGTAGIARYSLDPANTLIKRGSDGSYTPQTIKIAATRTDGGGNIIELTTQSDLDTYGLKLYVKFDNGRFGEMPMGQFIGAESFSNSVIWELREQSTVLTTATAIMVTDGSDGKDGEDGAPGTDGKDGKDGRGISSVSEYYGLSASANVEPTTWSTTVQTPTAELPYLWNYETTAYTTGAPTSTQKRVIGRFGADGRAIEKVIDRYLASALASGVTVSTAGWSTDAAAATSSLSESKPYLWNYEEIQYSKGNPTYTTPHITGHYGKDGAPGDQGEQGFMLVLAKKLTLSDAQWQDFNVAGQQHNLNREYIKLTGSEISRIRIGDYFQLYGQATDSGIYYKVTFRRITPPSGAASTSLYCELVSFEVSEKGALVYPAGVYEPTATYNAANDRCPVVYYNGNYYMLKSGINWVGTQHTGATPASDYAANGNSASWQLVDKFNSIFAEIVMADFAKLGSGVFWGDWFFSAKGTLNSKETDDYSTFNGTMAKDTFIPYWAVNLSNGKFYTNPYSADSIAIQDGILKAGTIGHNFTLNRRRFQMEDTSGSVEANVGAADSNGLFKVIANGQTAIYANAKGGYPCAIYGDNGTITARHRVSGFGFGEISGSGLNYQLGVGYDTYILRSTSSTWLQVILPSDTVVANNIAPYTDNESAKANFAVKLRLVCDPESVKCVSIRALDYTDANGSITPKGMFSNIYLYPGEVMEVLLLKMTDKGDTTSGGKGHYYAFNLNGVGHTAPN